MLCRSSLFQATAGPPLVGRSDTLESASARLRTSCTFACKTKQLGSWKGLAKAAQKLVLVRSDRKTTGSCRTERNYLQPFGQYRHPPYCLELKPRSPFRRRRHGAIACLADLESSVKSSRVGKEVTSAETSRESLSPEIGVEPIGTNGSVLIAKRDGKADEKPFNGQTLKGKANKRGLSGGRVSDGAAVSRKIPDAGSSTSTDLDLTGREKDGRISDKGGLDSKVSDGRVSDTAGLSSKVLDGQGLDKEGLNSKVLDRVPEKQGVSKPSPIAAVPGRTLLERGTRLIQTAPKGTRWGDALSEASPSVQGGENAGQSTPPLKPLDAIFGPIGRGTKPRFRREPQQDGPTERSPVSSSLSTLARPTSREWPTKKDFGLHKDSSSGFLVGYDYDDDVAVPTVGAFAPALGPSSDWVVETCPKCFGSAVTACDVCHASWQSGSCPKCNGKGYVACTNCKGSGTVYGPVKRAQPVKAQPPKPSVQSTGGQSEEGPSLIEAFRIIKNERRSKSTVSPSEREGSGNGGTGKPHWLKGRPISEEHKRKISQALQGRPRPPLTSAHKKKLSDIRREFFEQPGARERWSETAKKRRVMHCSHCYLPGHSSRFCPELGFVKFAAKPCPICGQPGHTRHGCPKRPNVSIPLRCKHCGEYGHEVVDCPNEPAFEGRILCEICGLPGHRNRECPKRPKELVLQRCSVCGQAGHNKRRCPERLREG